MKELTYISIDDRIAAHVKEGRLVEWVPTTMGPSHRDNVRQLWITMGVKDWLLPMGEHPIRGTTTSSIAAARAQCNAFVRGAVMLEDGDVKLMQPPENKIWEIRTHLQPQIRIFGWFYRQNGFIASKCRLRKRLNFDSTITAVKADFVDLFPSLQPFGGFSYSDHVKQPERGQ